MTFSFEVTKLLSLLLYPLSQALLLGVVALLLVWFHCRRAALAVLGIAIGWLYLASTGLVAGVLPSWWLVFFLLDLDYAL